MIPPHLTSNIKARLKPALFAALTHFSISVLVVAALYYLIYQVWYPQPFDDTLDVGQLFWLIAITDVCVAPLLTLVIFDKRKRHLAWELAFIGCLQIVALGYGLYNVAYARPVYMVFTKDRFDLVRGHELYAVDKDSPKLALKPQHPWASPWLGATTVAADLPDVNSELRSMLAILGMSGEIDVPNIIDQHRPYASALKRMQATGLPLASMQNKAKPPVANMAALNGKRTQGLATKTL